MLCAAFLCVMLCGCDMFTVDTDQLLSPPELTGDMYPIQQALNESAGSGYTLKYPSSGDRRSAVILEDINGDNTFEAFAFYSTVSEETSNMHINVICRVSEDEWRSVAVQSIAAGGVDRVDFCDLDGDGIKEILVGWEIYGSSEKQLAVYSLSGDVLSQRMLQQYTHFLCCDLDENGLDEVFVQLLNSSESSNSASLFSIDESGVSRIAGCIMDSSVETAYEPVVSTLSSGKPAVYIDEIKGIGAITEVLCFSKGSLVNNLLDSGGSMQNSLTLRSASLRSEDINNDGIIEIPVARELPSAFNSSSEKLYYTDWCSFNGEKLTEKMVTAVNTADGYYIIIPEKWVGAIAMEKNTDKRFRTVYAYDPVTALTGDRLAYFKAIAEEEYDPEEDLTGDMTELGRHNGTVFIGRAENPENPAAVTAAELKGIFRLYN